MPWTRSNYPSPLKYLRADAREKAIEIANAMLAENYDENRALAIVTTQIQKWVETHYDGSEPPLFAQDVHVVPHPRGWAVRRAYARKNSFVFESMSEARNKALQIGQEDYVRVVLHDSDGRIQDNVEPNFVS